MIDVQRVAALIEEVAAAEILPRFRQLGEGDIREKSPGDLVTVADEAAEAALAARLTALLPGSVVVGEEAAAADPEILDRLSGEDYVWIVDPVDGTSNFAAGRPEFGVIVALARRDEVIAGWIHDPVGRRTVTAEKGGGAWSAGERLHAARPGLLSAMSGRLWLRGQENQDLVRKSANFAAAYTLRCAALEYMRLAVGELHFAFYRVSNKPWDHAAGVLVHAEAGGHAARLNGDRYRPSEMKGGLLLAPDAESWRRILDVLLG